MNPQTIKTHTDVMVTDLDSDTEMLLNNTSVMEEGQGEGSMEPVMDN